MPTDIVIDVKGLSKSFGSRSVLDDVSLTVRRGAVVAVIGPSGVGKSTLLRCINYLVPFEAGTIDVFGERLVGEREMAPGDRSRMHAALPRTRGRVGMVFQSFNLFPHLTVHRNLTLAPRSTGKLDAKTADERAHALLSRFGLQDKADVYPRHLSGGQQQRVAICRALAMEPEVMLFDEVTSMLDPELVGEVLGAMKELADDGMTMIIVTHEMGFARDVADEIVMMADQRIIETGPPSQLFAEPREERTRVFLRRILDRESAIGTQS